MPPACSMSRKTSQGPLIIFLKLLPTVPDILQAAGCLFSLARWLYSRVCLTPALWREVCLMLLQGNLFTGVFLGDPRVPSVRRLTPTACGKCSWPVSRMPPARPTHLHLLCFIQVSSMAYFPPSPSVQAQKLTLSAQARGFSLSKPN